MKKIVASVGVIAIGLTGLRGATTLGGDGSKPWNVSLALRGFYDDNINTLPSNVAPPPGSQRASAGWSVSPQVGLIWSSPQTSLTFNYIYTFLYYENKPINNSEFYDQNQVFTLALNHAFSERYQIEVRDSFVMGQEPDMLRAGNSPFSTIQRISGDNIVNYGAVDFNGQLTRLLGFSVGYANGYYRYAQSEPQFPPTASLAGTLNRIENTVHLDSRWILEPETIAIFGYQYRQVGYTAGQPIGDNGNDLIFSQNRNYQQNYLYVGGDHTFRPDLTGSMRIGASYIDFYNGGTGNTWSPYFLGSLRYNYMANCFVEFGASVDMSSTDIVQAQGTSNGFISSALSSLVYASVSHQLTQKLTGTVRGSYQNSNFQGTGSDQGLTEQYFLLGLNLAYAFTPHLSGNLGYNYDNVTSEVQRSYDRNRVYLGLTASY